MKYILFVLLMFGTPAFSQELEKDQSLLRTDFLKKSKNQKTAAWIATGVGTTIILGTVLSAASDPFPEYGEDNTESVGTVPALIGLACIGTGAYLFIASGRNKKKANVASVFIDIEKAPALTKAVFSNKSFPAIGVRVCF